MLLAVSTCCAGRTEEFPAMANAFEFQSTVLRTERKWKGNFRNAEMWRKGGGKVEERPRMELCCEVQVLNLFILYRGPTEEQADCNVMECRELTM